MEKSLNQHISEMKNLGNVLMPFNYPKSTSESEDTINILKSRDVCVDGYDLILHYNKSDYGTYRLETLQVLGKYCPFLPFFLVCKVAKKFLGDKQLFLLEVFNDGRKIYCWTLITDEQGEPSPAPYEDNSTDCVYEGFEYKTVNSKNVTFQ